MDSWFLHWNTRRQDEPRIRGVGPNGDTHLDFASDPGGSWTALDGYLFDIDPSLGPAAAAHEAAEKEPRDFVDGLRGAFALCHWDPTARRLTLGRDVMGIRPLFYWWQNGTLIASSSIGAIRSLPAVDDAINRQLTAQMLAHRFHMGQATQTYFRNIHRLPFAHRLVLDGRGLRTQRYWDPLPARFEWAGEDELARFPELLENSVRQCLDAGVDSLALSGGFDSVSLAILAQALRGEAPPLRALSLRMVETPVDEGAVQAAVAAALGMPQTMRSLKECLQGTSLPSDALAQSGTSPSPVLSVWQSAYTTLLGLGRQQGVSKLMLGTGGDETLGVDRTWGADCLAAGQLGALWRFYRAARRTSPFSAGRIANVVLWSGTLRPLLLRGLSGSTKRWSPPVHERLRQLRRQRWQTRLPWLEPDVWLTIDRQEKRDLESQSRYSGSLYRNTLRQLVQHPMMMLEMDQGALWARYHGYQQFFPFWSRELVDMLLRVHPDQLIAGGRFKTPLRRLVAERLPEVELPSRKVDFRQGATNLLRTAGRQCWRELDGALELERLEIVRAPELHRFMAAFFSGQNDKWLNAWLVLSTEYWLRAARSKPVRAVMDAVSP